MRKGFTLIELMIVIAIIAIIAAIAIPNLLESRVTANEAAASASLKSGVFPGQVQFQGGGYQDVDADNVGEYGTLRALGGITATNKIAASSIKLLQGPLASSGSWTPSADIATVVGTAAPAGGVATGYRYACWAASETGTNDATLDLWCEGEAAPTAMSATTNSANNGERYWAAACAPEKFGDTGRRAFMISNDGQVRSPSTTAALAAFFGGTAPTNGTASSAANIAQGIQYTYTGTMAALGLTALEGTIVSTVPVYAR